MFILTHIELSGCLIRRSFVCGRMRCCATCFSVYVRPQPWDQSMLEGRNGVCELRGVTVRCLRHSESLLAKLNLKRKFWSINTYVYATRTYTTQVYYTFCIKWHIAPVHSSVDQACLQHEPNQTLDMAALAAAGLRTTHPARSMHGSGSLLMRGPCCHGAAG